MAFKGLSAKQINPTETPELFHLGRQVDPSVFRIDAEYSIGDVVTFGVYHFSSKVDNNIGNAPDVDYNETYWRAIPKNAVKQVYDLDTGELISTTIYDATSLDVSSEFNEGIAIRKMAVGGDTQDVHVYDDITKLYRNNDLVCESKVYMDKKSLAWENYNFGKTTVEKTDIGAKASKDITPNSFKVEIDSDGGDPKTTRVNKQKYTLQGDAGDIIRCRWELKAYTLDDLILDYSDYKGNTSDTGWVYNEAEEYWERTIIFEPDGVIGQLTIDPYLSITEPANFVDVTCDGFLFSLRTASNTSYGFHLYNLAKTDNFGTLGFGLGVSISGGNDYFTGRDPNKEVIIQEDTPSRVVLKLACNLYDTTPTVLDSDDTVEVIFTIYPDRVIQHVKWVSNANHTLDSSSGNRVGFGLGFSNPVEENEDDYDAMLGDEVNLMMIDVYHTDDSLFRKYHTTTQLQSDWYNGTINAGTHEMVLCWIIDSAEREGGKQYDGSQYTANEKFSDDFSVGSVLGSDWANFGSQNFVIDNEQAKAGTTWDNCMAYYDTESLSDDHWVKADVKNEVDSNAECGLFCRYHAVNDTGYCVYFGTSGNIIIRSWNGSNFTYEDENTTQYPAGVYEIMVKIVGDTLHLYIDDVFKEAFDISGFANYYSSGGYAGMRADSSSSLYPYIDNFSCGIFSADDRLAIGAHIKASADGDEDATINTGSEVTDQNIPDILNSDDGFAADLARWIDHASNVVKLTFPQTEYFPAVVLPNWGIRTGTVGSATEHLIGHWKCDDNAASTTISATVGSGVALVGGDNTEDKSSSDAVRGTSLLLNGTDDGINLLGGDNAINDLSSEDEWTILITAKANFSVGDGDQGLFGAYGGGDYVQIDFNDTGDQVYFRNLLGSLNESIISPVMTSNELQQFNVYGLHLNATEGVMYASINGKIIGAVNGTMTWAGSISICEIGITPFNTYGAWYIDEVKLYNGCLLPNTAYFTGNGEVNTDVAHTDLLCYLDFEGATETIRKTCKISVVEGSLNGSAAINTDAVVVSTYGFDSGGTFNDYFSITVTSSNIINPKKGSISMIINFNASVANYTPFWGFGDADDYIRLTTGNGVIIAQYRSQSTTEAVTGSISISTNTVYFIKMDWDDADGDGILELFINNISEGTDTIANAWDGITSGTMYFGTDYGTGSGQDIWIDQVFITSDPNTPQIPTIFGTPIHVPLLRTG